jgi:hypothetical protein
MQDDERLVYLTAALVVPKVGCVMRLARVPALLFVMRGL